MDALGTNLVGRLVGVQLIQVFVRQGPLVPQGQDWIEPREAPEREEAGVGLGQRWVAGVGCVVVVVGGGGGGFGLGLVVVVVVVVGVGVGGSEERGGECVGVAAVAACGWWWWWCDGVCVCVCWVVVGLFWGCVWLDTMTPYSPHTHP
jgi:hypothetical protein